MNTPAVNISSRNSSAGDEGVVAVSQWATKLERLGKEQLLLS